MLETGIKNRKCLSVGQAETALSMGSGTLPVLATPAMIALMEATAAESVEPLLEEGVTSVGTRIEVSHLAADPIGATVMCESELVEVDGRKLSFRLTVRDREGMVGEGTHERFLVRKESFLKKAEGRTGDHG